MDNQPIQPQSAPLPNPPSHSKIFIIITSVILLTMIGVGSYVLGTRKNQTVVKTVALLDGASDWKTYTSSKWGFSIEYPPQQYAIPENQKDEEYGKLYVGFNAGEYNVQIIVQQSIDDLTLDDPMSIYKALQRYGQFREFLNTDIKQISLGGQRAYRLNNCCKVEYYGVAEALIVSIRDNILYSIRIYNGDGGEKNSFGDKKTIEKVITSFKFIPFSSAPTPYVFKSNNIRGWKIYRNKLMGYSISYPSSYTVFMGSDQADKGNHPITISPRALQTDQFSPGYSIHIYIHNNAENLSYEDPKELFSNGSVSFSPEVLNKVQFYEISLDGNKALRADRFFVPTYSGTGYQAQIKAIKNNMVYEISAEPEETYLIQNADKNAEKKLFEKILSTFQFLN